MNALEKTLAELTRKVVENNLSNPCVLVRGCRETSQRNGALRSQTGLPG